MNEDDRALDAWAALVHDALVTGRRGRRLLDGPGGAPAPLWPLTMVLWAAAEVEALGGAPPLGDLQALLERYRRGDAYAASPRSRRRFVDDNAWLGLASLRLAEVTHAPAWRRVAADAAAFALTTEHPDGGLPWFEGSSSRNACSTASSAWLAQAAGAPGAREHAGRWLGWIRQALLRPDGLVADGMEGTRLVPRVWSYNQGATIAALDRHGDDVAPLVEAALTHFTLDRLWREPIAFVAIFFRALDGVPAAHRAVLPLFQDYVERLRTQGHDPRTGWFTAGGVGSYDGKPTIDQAGAVQLLAQAFSSRRR